MDNDLKLAMDMAILLIVHHGKTPTKAAVNEAARRVVASGLVPSMASRMDELVEVVSKRYPQQINDTAGV